MVAADVAGFVTVHFSNIEGFLGQYVQETVVTGDFIQTALLFTN